MGDVQPGALGGVRRPGPAPVKLECAFGAEISENRDRAAIAKAWRVPQCPVTVEIAWYGSPLEAAAVLGGYWTDDDPVTVVLDPQSQSATMLAPLAEAGVLVRKLTAQDVAVAHGEFADLIRTGGLRHRNQPELTAAARAAQERRLAGARAIERRVMTDQSPLTAAEFAVFGFLRWEELAQPGAWQM